MIFSRSLLPQIETLNYFNHLNILKPYNLKCFYNVKYSDDSLKNSNESIHCFANWKCWRTGAHCYWFCSTDWFEAVCLNIEWSFSVVFNDPVYLFNLRAKEHKPQTCCATRILQWTSMSAIQRKTALIFIENQLANICFVLRAQRDRLGALYASVKVKALSIICLKYFAIRHSFCLWGSLSLSQPYPLITARGKKNKTKKKTTFIFC